MKSTYALIILITLAFFTLSLSACSGVKTEARYPTGHDRAATGGDIYAEPQGIFGKGGLFGMNKRGEDEEGGSGIAVNSYLWRASLDTVSFMPLASADPFGGTILTDWYSDPQTPNERFKVNVFILGKQLRSDGVRVRVFKQVAQKGTWFDSETASETARQLEDAILTRARQLRAAQDG